MLFMDTVQGDLPIAHTEDDEEREYLRLAPNELGSDSPPKNYREYYPIS